jgi:uncharacterized protein YndB with AHSA1/START domain
MTTQAQAASVRSRIVVDAPIERAFSVFTEQFDRIKPREHNLLGVDIAETVFEPRVGGSIYDRGVDGSECRWARVLAYEPPERVVFSWDIGPTGRSRPTPTRPARWRCASSRRRLSGLEWSSSTATSIATATTGRACARASRRPKGGRCTCSGTAPSSRADAPGAGGRGTSCSSAAAWASVKTGSGLRSERVVWLRVECRERVGRGRPRGRRRP